MYYCKFNVSNVLKRKFAFRDDALAVESEELLVTSRAVITRSGIQSGKTYCAAFCASLALVACSGNYASCSGSAIGESTADWYLGTRGRRSVDLSISGPAWIFFGSSLLKRQCSRCLLRGSLAYIFSGLLINMRYVKRVCGKIVSSGFANLLHVNFFRKKIGSPREHYTSFPLETLECCWVAGKLQKQGKFVTSFVYKIDEIPAIFFKIARLARS